MDQAWTLRQLATKGPSLDVETNVVWRRPDMLRLVVTSGKGGVGKSVVSSNLAVALSNRGLRTLIVDADLMFPNLDLLFGLRPRFTLLEAVQTRAPIDEACFQLSDYLWLLPSRAVEAQYLGIEMELVHRLLRFLDITERFDAVVLDTASGLGGRSAHLSAGASEVWIVTTSAATAIADSYAMAKYLLALGAETNLALVLNGVKGYREAEDLHRRFAEVTSHFLHREIPMAGWIPFDRKVENAVEQEKPFTHLYPKSNAAKAMRKMAEDTLLRCAGIALKRERVAAAAIQGTW